MACAVEIADTLPFVAGQPRCAEWIAAAAVEKAMTLAKVVKDSAEAFGQCNGVGSARNNGGGGVGSADGDGWEMRDSSYSMSAAPSPHTGKDSSSGIRGPSA